MLCRPRDPSGKANERDLVVIEGATFSGSSCDDILPMSSKTLRRCLFRSTL